MTEKKRIIFVVNPISGTQGKKAILKCIDERLDRSIYDYSIVKTEYAGHATQIAANAVREKVDVVVAIGGDGTINEIARSLVHTETALGIIPCGSGNGLARHLRIPMEPKAAIDVINRGYELCIDYGKINNILFFCTCGVGFDAFISLKFADSGKGIVSVMHDLPMALTFSDSIAVLSEGEILFFGTPEELLKTEVIKQVFRITIDHCNGEYFYQILSSKTKGIKNE